jgi:hypothetical protein
VKTQYRPIEEDLVYYENNHTILGMKPHLPLVDLPTLLKVRTGFWDRIREKDLVHGGRG